MKATLMTIIFLSPIYLIFWVMRKIENAERESYRQSELTKSFKKAKEEK